MGCSGCSSGGCGTLPKGCKNNGSCGVGGCGKLNVFDWLSGMSLADGVKRFEFVEVRFKGTRKEFYKNTDELELNIGDVVAVEAASGHDIGVVSLTGELVKVQMKRKKVNYQNNKDIKKIYRIAKQADVEKWMLAQEQEKKTMYKARKSASDLKLNMKISDVEYQGDMTKATFYYTAEERVDFRELIKILADEFKVKIEMRQIGARQEAGRLGGIGSCGRELCCSTWLTDFRTVSTSAARYQQLSLNPQKLAGQCGKLKCCLNYELDTYLDALSDFPEGNITLRTKKGPVRLQKTDIFSKTLWFTYDDNQSDFIPLSLEKVKEVMALNEKGIFPPEIKPEADNNKPVEVEPDYENVVGQDSLNRFANQNNNKKKKNKNKKRKDNRPKN
jgi:cell fate regulator YaaT (PSP1 superfamily)